MSDSYGDSDSYSRSSSKTVGTYLGMTKEDLLSTYGAPFIQLSEPARLAAAMEARTEDLLAKFAPAPLPVTVGTGILAKARTAADGALTELTGSYGHLVEEGVRALLDARGDEEAQSAAVSTLHEASATMVLTDLERLSDVIGLLMIVGMAESRPAGPPRPTAPHPQSYSLRAGARDYSRRTVADRHIISDTAGQHDQSQP